MWRKITLSILGFAALALFGGCASKPIPKPQREDFAQVFSRYVFQQCKNPGTKDAALLTKAGGDSTSSTSPTIIELEKEISARAASSRTSIAEWAASQDFLIAESPLFGEPYLARISRKDESGVRVDILLHRRSPLSAARFVELDKRLRFVMPLGIQGRFQKRESNQGDPAVLESLRNDYEYAGMASYSALIADLGQQRILKDCGIQDVQRYTDVLYTAFASAADSINRARDKGIFLTPPSLANRAIEGLLFDPEFAACPWLIIPMVARALHPATFAMGDDAVNTALQMYFVGSAYTAVAKKMRRSPTFYEVAVYLYNLVGGGNALAMKNFLTMDSDAASIWSFARYHAQQIYAQVLPTQKSQFAFRMLLARMPVADFRTNVKIPDTKLRVEQYGSGELPEFITEASARNAESKVTFLVPVRAFLGGMETCKAAMYYQDKWWRICPVP